MDPLYFEPFLVWGRQPGWNTCFSFQPDRQPGFQLGFIKPAIGTTTSFWIILILLQFLFP
jgi:hypothetical protein